MANEGLVAAILVAGVAFSLNFALHKIDEGHVGVYYRGGPSSTSTSLSSHPPRHPPLPIDRGPPQVRLQPGLPPHGPLPHHLPLRPGRLLTSKCPVVREEREWTLSR